jgi:hypothetical protein
VVLEELAEAEGVKGCVKRKYAKKFGLFERWFRAEWKDVRGERERSVW